MKYKNPICRKGRKIFTLEVSCGLWKSPLLIYVKIGNGNLIKLQMPRIKESNVDFKD